MKVIILGKMIESSLKERTEMAVRFFASELMSTRMCNTLKIKVEIRRGGKHFSGEMKNYGGMAYNICNGSNTQKDHLIVMQHDLSQSDFIEVLAHEMVHVKQISKNELQKRRWKSDKKLHARWKGEEMGEASSIPYMQRPWEVEAYSMQKDLAMKFKKSFWR